MKPAAEEALRLCTRSLARPGSAEAGNPVAWAEFCDPRAGWLSRGAREWQRLGGFAHHRAGTVLVAFRASWLALCATIPEYHLGLDVPSLGDVRVGVSTSGVMEVLILPDRPCPVPAAEGRDREWWRNVSTFITPLTRGLEALGGPPATSDQYWGNAVGLIGEVLRRLAVDGAGGDVLATATDLRSATGRNDLLSLRAVPGGLWSRRGTCCQMWRSGCGYCTECVLHDSPARRQR